MGRTIYRTTDGGQSWQAAGLSGRFIGHLTITTEQIGWAQVVNGHATGGTQLTSLYRTTDGGATWTLVAENQVGEQALKNFPFAGMKSGVTFLDERTGFATGSYSQVSRLFFFTTRDGGTTWQEQPLPLPDVLTKDIPDGEGLMGSAPVLVAADGTLVLRVNSRRCSSGQGCAAIFTSPDQGKTWQATAPLSHPVTDFDFADAAHGWATAGATIYRTADGGRTWTPVAEAEGVTDLDFVNEATGFMLARGLLYKTEDGGGTWTAE